MCKNLLLSEAAQIWTGGDCVEQERRHCSAEDWRATYLTCLHVWPTWGCRTVVRGIMSTDLIDLTGGCRRWMSRCLFLSGVIFFAQGHLWGTLCSVSMYGVKWSMFTFRMTFSHNNCERPQLGIFHFPSISLLLAYIVPHLSSWQLWAFLFLIFYDIFTFSMNWADSHTRSIVHFHHVLWHVTGCSLPHFHVMRTWPISFRVNLPTSFVQTHSRSSVV